MTKLNFKHEKLVLIIVGFVAIASAFSIFFIYRDKSQNVNNKNTAQQTSIENKQPMPTTTPTPIPTTAWPFLLTANEASSLAVVVNKKHQLPADYVPVNLTSLANGQQVRSSIFIPIQNMTNDATVVGLDMIVVSGYRSYQTQSYIYNNFVNQYGAQEANNFSAKPGHSEHQTGLAIDVGLYGGACNLETCLGDTPIGKWIAANVPNYGFIIRYPQGKEDITGYQYEPWHLRYVGINTAKAITTSGQTMDEYFGVPAGNY